MPSDLVILSLILLRGFAAAGIAIPAVSLSHANGIKLESLLADPKTSSIRMVLKEFERFGLPIWL